MTHRTLILLALTTILFAACNDTTRRKKYSITESFINYDSSKGQVGKTFKYAYEEYNADSNLIYQEIYTNSTDNFSDMWGKLKEIRNLFYSGRLQTKQIIEIKIPYISPEGGGDKDSYTYSYEYNAKNLTKILFNKKPIEEYRYDSNNHQIERRISSKANIPDYYRFIYRNGLKIGAIHYVADSIVGTDSLTYDKNNKHIGTFSRYKNGNMSDTLIERNSRGQVIEKKWRAYFKTYTDYPFYNTNKYVYDNFGRLIKIEYYLANELKTIHQFNYN